MKEYGKIWRQGLCATGLSIMVLLGNTYMAQGVSSYRATPQGVETPAEMQSYDPHALHIIFGKRPQAAEAETLLQPASAPDPAPEEFFDPARRPGGETSGPEAPVSPSAPEEAPAGPQQLNVPEPGTFALLGLGLAALMFACRKKKTS